jgi:orotate phosphoribosyltransferase
MVNRLAQELIAHHAIEFGSFTLASGAKSDYYIDIKSAVTDPRLLASIAKEAAGRCRFDIVAGVAVGGIPLAVSVSLETGKPYAIIRSAQKDHGKKNPVIGNVAGKTVLLIEDVTTSGGSALYGIEMLRAAGAVIDSVITVVDREQGAKVRLMERGARLIPLVRVSELLKGK